MTIPVVCPNCFTRMSAPEKAAGRMAKCLKYGHPLTIAPSLEDGNKSTQPKTEPVPAPSEDGKPSSAKVPARPNEWDDWGDKLYAWAKKNKETVIITAGAGITLLIVVLSVAFPTKGGRPSKGVSKMQTASVYEPKRETKLTRDNFLRLKRGMSESQVRLILGPPTDSNYEAWTRNHMLHWVEEQNGRKVHITIVFHEAINGQVTITALNCTGLD